MKILYGTSNRAKLIHMREWLKELDLEILGLEDVRTGELPDVEEHGNNPLENAIIKAEAYYELFKMPVFSCDSGLFFENIPEDLQPGIRVRNIGGKYLSDDEMIDYYGNLAKMNGDIVARYKNAICFILDENSVYKSMNDDLSGEKFILTHTPHLKREKGLPLDSLSVHIPTGKYYYDLDNYKVDDAAIKSGFVSFFKGILQD